MKIANLMAFFALAALGFPVWGQEAPVPREIQEAVKGLKDPDPKIRAKAAWVLGDQGKYAVPVIDELIAAFAEPKLGVRASLADAFGQMRTSAKKAVPTLLTGLKDEDQHVRRRVVCALGLIKSEPQIVVPALVEALKDPDNGKDLAKVYVPQGAVIALGNFGPEAKAAVPHLLKILHNPEIEWRFLVVSPLGQIGDPEVVPHLLKYMDEQTDIYMRGRIAGALAYFGPKAKDGIPRIVALLKTKGNDQKTLSAKGYAAAVLGKMGSAATPETIDVLVQILKDKKLPWDLRQNAARSLGELGPKVAKNAIPALIDVLDEMPFQPITDSLAAMGSEAVPHLLPFVKRGEKQFKKDYSARIRVLRVFERMGPEAKEAIPVLYDLVKTENQLVSPHAERALDSVLGLGQNDKK